MIGDRFNSGVVLTLAGVLLTAFALCTASGAEKRRGQSLDFSDGASSQSSTNQTGRKKDGLRQLEEELYQPLQNLAPKSSGSSLDAVMPPLATRPSTTPPISSKRAKEIRERMQNWIFLSPDEQMKGLTPEEIFNMPEYDANGQEKKKLSAIEKFYQRLERERDGRNSLTGDKDKDVAGAKKSDSEKDTADTDEADKTKDKGKDKDKDSQFVLKSIFDQKSSLSPLAGQNELPDIFGLRQDKDTPSTDDLERQKLRSLDFQKMYGNPFSFGGAGDTAAHAPSSFGGLSSAAGYDPLSSSVAHSGIGGMDFQSSTIAPSVKPAALPDLTTPKGSDASGVGSVQFKVTPPTPSITPVAPSFMPPKRVF